MSGTQGSGGMGGDSSTRYERLDRIATGGMGEVWRARDTVLGREVAVKVLKQEYADDPTFRARFADEARHAASLHHPGIAAIFDFGAVEGETPYLVMELVDGRPLSDLLSADRPVDPEQARLLTLQVAEALAVAHRAGVVHRDVKPANLLVTPDGRIKITDFGIARAVDSVPYTQTGQIVGTPHYISPEQARGESATSASDVYALGVVLFECLNGTRPFDADSPIATALAHIRDEVPPLPDHVPPALDRVVRRAMAKNPAERYADGAAFAEALREAGGPDAAAPPPPAETTQVLPAAVPAAVAAAAVAPDTSETPVVDEPPAEKVTTTTTSNRWPLYAAGVLALIVVVALLIARPWSDDTSADDGTTDDRVQVNASAYIGDPVEKVEAALAEKGLETKVNEVSNSGNREAGIVADLSPTGRVEPGTTITLDVWGEPPADEGDQGDEGRRGRPGARQDQGAQAREAGQDRGASTRGERGTRAAGELGGREHGWRPGHRRRGCGDTGGAGDTGARGDGTPAGRANQQGKPSTGKGD